uniref:HAT C-terminal dimerisation domain-containing protein n=1 Tax=Oncorhynchus tshawytscha TaxID=74940 RepID=A0AAZ3PQP0_ONCTS
TAFCFQCRVFGKNIQFDSFVNNGRKNLKKALIIFGNHEMAQTYRDSVVAWQSYQATSSHGNIAQILTSAYASDIAERREYLRRIGLSFHANDEITNRGNFIECMELLKFDPFLQRYNTPSNVTYLSPEPQNDMIECCAQEITDTTVSKMSKSGMYTIMVDEARDGQSEQLALCVRYVTERTVKELNLVLCHTCRAIVETAEFFSFLENVYLFSSHDGAAVMSGSKGVVQAHFRVLHPEAVYIHCYAHELILVLCHTCRAIPEAAEFFSFLENMYSFFRTSLVNHHKFKEAQCKLGIASAELVQLSNTRWACQLCSMNAVLDTLTAIFDCLSAILSTMVVALRAKLHKFFTFLQKETVDLAEACFGKQAVCDTLMGKCTDAFAIELYDRTKSLCEIHNTPEADAARKRKQKKIPNSNNFLDTSCLTEFTKHYSIDVKTEEMLVARNFLGRKREAGCPPKDMLAVHNLLGDDMFPSLKEIIQVALTIIVSICSCERSFSALRRLHSWLRKKMGQKSLASLAAMSIEGEVLGPLSHNSVIDRFATFKNRYTLMRPPT